MIRIFSEFYQNVKKKITSLFKTDSEIITCDREDITCDID